MKIKNIFTVIAITCAINLLHVSANIHAAQEPTEEKQLREYRQSKRKPRNPKETSTSSKTIYHDNRGGWLRPHVGNARIYFDVDESGEPCYQMIGEHFEKNPQFKEVELVVYHKRGLFRSENFEKIGYMADERA